MFNSREVRQKPGSKISEDRLRSVDFEVVFRRLHCYKCDLTAVYKYRVKQIRRQSELQSEADHPPASGTAGPPDDRAGKSSLHDASLENGPGSGVGGDCVLQDQAEVSPGDEPVHSEADTPLLSASQEERPAAAAEISDFDLAMWQAIPRFAEIPETVRCKRCGEVLGLCPEVIY